MSHRGIIFIALFIILIAGAVFSFNQNYRNRTVACTLEVKICPDGSSVGRIGPRCEFAPCPNASTSTP